MNNVYLQSELRDWCGFDRETVPEADRAAGAGQGQGVCRATWLFLGSLGGFSS